MPECTYVYRFGGAWIVPSHTCRVIQGFPKQTERSHQIKMRKSTLDDDGQRGLAGGSHDAFRPSRSCLLKPRVRQLLNFYKTAHPFSHQLIFPCTGSYHVLVQTSSCRPVGLRFTFPLRQCSFRDQSHLGTWGSRWTNSKHDLHQRPIPWPSINTGLWRQCRGKQHSVFRYILYVI